jgi:hypothetical protein
MEQYLLIKAGYEGIEKLVYLSDDPEIVKNMIIELRKEADKELDKLKEIGIDADAYDDKWELNEKIGELYVNEVISGKSYSILMERDESGGYCIQKWDGEKFKCHCKELGVGLEKNWFY